MVGWTGITSSWVTAQPTIWRTRSVDTTLKRGDEGEVVAPYHHTWGCLVLVSAPRPMSSTTRPSPVETYIGSTNDFARRYYKHRTDAKNPDYRTATTLSVYIWKLKDEGKNFQVSWRILDRAPLYDYSSKLCGLCRMESYFVLFRPNLATLNKNHKIFRPCPQRLFGL